MTKNYFLGRPTPDGFSTHITDEIKSGKYYTYILKGGPGTGKSSLMRKIASKLGEDCELFYCSSDPDSLDGVLCPEQRILILDGTAPHVVEPRYPGVCEKLIDLGVYWDSDMLKNSASEIIRLTDENAKLHGRAKRCLGAAVALCRDIEAISESGMLGAKLDAFCERLGARLLPKTKRPKGKISFRQITSVTPKGVITHNSAFDGCKRYFIDDKWLAVTDHMLKRLSILATEKGYDCIASENPFLGGCEYQHLIIPELGIAFVSGIIKDFEVRVNAERFYDRVYLRTKRERIGFDVAASGELIRETSHALKQAKENHDELEKHYVKAMDFEAVGRLTEQLIREIIER